MHCLLCRRFIARDAGEGVREKEDTGSKNIDEGKEEREKEREGV